MTEERLNFQAEVSRLLDIVAHSLYSEREVFLRELISNASDACDKLRYAAITDPELTAGDTDFRITLDVDEQARTLTVSDNGIGMNREDVIDNLGTIAKSGTGGFLDQLTGDAKKDVNLIGQFGVGFYAAFMVADKVTVITRRAGEDQAWRWESDGRGGFVVDEAERAGRGTDVILHLKEDAGEFLERERLNRIVLRYSDHIGLPILFGTGAEAEQLNTASALWTRPKSEIEEGQYTEFYRHVSHGFDEPWHTMHWKAEGVIEYTGLLFVPSTRPFDLFDPSRRHGVKLYVKRVFITDEAEGLVPGWLRFLRGVIDSEDLPLNISREMLQNNPTLARIRNGITKRVLGELEKQTGDAERYATFWQNFGAVLKEGLYEDSGHRDQLLKLARFRSTRADGWTSLADYIGRMKEGQQAIYYMTGDDEATLSASPQLEGYRDRGVEVLLLTDPIDEFWVTSVGSHEGHAFKSVTKGAADLDAIKGDEANDANSDASDTENSDAEAAAETLIALFKQTLGGAVKDVRISKRLKESPVCLIADENDMDIHLARLLRQHKQLDQETPRIFEINPRHPLIKALAARAGTNGTDDSVGEAAWVLLDQARILEGETPADAAQFSRRLSNLLMRGF